MAAINIKGQIWNGPIAKIYRHEMFSQQTNFMLLSLNEQFFLPVSLISDYFRHYNYVYQVGFIINYTSQLFN